MTPPRQPPPNASVAHAGEGAKLRAPSAEKNREAIATLLTEVAPAAGQALELASGTGQHVVTFARALPGLNWQPTEQDPERIASINAYVAEAALPNLNHAQMLDATKEGWSGQVGSQDLIVLINLLHLISLPEALRLISEAARALGPGGVFLIYGPFMRSGALTSAGDAAFHQSLAAQDADIGYKNDTDILEALQQARLTRHKVVEMPANNLALLAAKPD